MGGPQKQWTQNSPQVLSIFHGRPGKCGVVGTRFQLPGVSLDLDESDKVILPVRRWDDEKMVWTAEQAPHVMVERYKLPKGTDGRVDFDMLPLMPKKMTRFSPGEDPSFHAPNENDLTTGKMEPDVKVNLGSPNMIATISLARPKRLNAIDDVMPREIAQCVSLANADDRVHAIILQGLGRAFCAGYDLKEYSEGSPVGDASPNQGMPWDPTVDFHFMWANTQDFMSLWHSFKPTICKVHGFAVAGGSDIALCCDLVVMAEDAKIGYPPARVWGCPTTAMWTFRLGPERAKRMLLTGDLITGTEAAQMGLVLRAVPVDQLDATVLELARRMSSVPRNQLMMQKMVINQSIEASMAATQRLATFFDGVTRHSPEGMWFKARAEAVGFAQAVKERDQGDFIAPEAPDPIEAAMPALALPAVAGFGPRKRHKVRNKAFLDL
eukprot:s940_g3.t1